MKLISKSEIKYILGATLFGFFYFVFLLPYLLGIGAESWSPYLQFSLFGLGIYIFYFFILKSYSLGTKVSLLQAITSFIPFIALDLMQPEYHINFTTGELIKGATLGASSSDYVLGYFWQSIGFVGFITVIMVYLASVFILLLINSLIKKNSIKEIN
ncbi:MAG: hypothetical protein WC915_06575 [archaeon]|jgi:hypothetical protein